jgi:hypothetical protein
VVARPVAFVRTKLQEIVIGALSTTGDRSPTCTQDFEVAVVAVAGMAGHKNRTLCFGTTMYFYQLFGQKTEYWRSLEMLSCHLQYLLKR